MMPHVDTATHGFRQGPHVLYISAEPAATAHHRMGTCHLLSGGPCASHTTQVSAQEAVSQFVQLACQPVAYPPFPVLRVLLCMPVCLPSSYGSSVQPWNLRQ